MWRLLLFVLLVVTWCSSIGTAQAPAEVPLFKVDQQDSSIKFGVKASVRIDGTFDNWDGTLTFASTEPESGVLDVKIQAASVDTGSGMKDGKLKGKDFFDVEKDPLITFHSTKVVQTGPTTFDVDFNLDARPRPGQKQALMRLAAPA